MTTPDTETIRHLTARQFNGLCWTPNNSADWNAFAADFAPCALLYPSARPAQPQSVESFVERMKGLGETSLHTFFEAPLGTVVYVFGNVAIAAAGCEMTENGTRVSRGVEMMLLIKDENGSKILRRRGTPKRARGFTSRMTWRRVIMAPPE